MQFLKTLFWVVLAAAVVLFASSNWTPATINLWGGLQADVKLPVLIFAAFLIGFLPTFLYYRARLWSLQRRIATYDRNLAVQEAQRAAPAVDAEHKVSGIGTTDAPHPTAADIGPSV